MTPVCRECGHSEDDHKYYPQSVTLDGQDEVEEYWSCRHGMCDCSVSWSDTPFDNYTCSACMRLRKADGPAVVLWISPNGTVELLCQVHLDIWLDNADDDDSLEPASLTWLAATLEVQGG